MGRDEQDSNGGDHPEGATAISIERFGLGFLALYALSFGMAALFVAFQVNARLGEGVERRDVIAVMATLFAACWLVAWAVPSLAVIAGCYIISRIGTGLFLFNLYNYTAVAYPTRIRSVAFAWTGSWALGRSPQKPSSFPPAPASVRTTTSTRRSG